MIAWARAGMAAVVTHIALLSTCAPALDAATRRVEEQGRNAWHWLRRNSFSPAWLPAEWRGARAGYVVGTVLQVVAFLLSMLIGMSIPGYAFHGAVPLLALVLVALNFGAGPSLWSALVGAILSVFMLDWARAPYADMATGAKAIGFLIYFLVGAAVSIFASQSERARRSAMESLAVAREAQAMSERAAAALALERSRTNAVLASIPDQLVIFDATGTILTANHDSALATPSAPGPLSIGQAAVAFHLRAPDGRDLAPEELPASRVLRGESEVTNVEVLARMPDGAERSWLLSAAPIVGEDTSRLGVVTLARDITALRAAERAAALEDASLAATFEAMTDGVLLYGLDAQIVRGNRAINDMLGYHLIPNFTALTVAERAWRVVVRDREGKILPPDRLPQVRALSGETLTGANAVDLRIRTLYGTEIAVSAQAAPLRNAGGYIIGSVCVFRDVTDRVRVEDRLHRALEALMEMVGAIAASPSDGDSQHVERVIAQRVADLTSGVLGCKRVSISALGPKDDVMRPVALVGLAPEEAEVWWKRTEEHPPHLSMLLNREELRRFAAGEAVALDVGARMSEARDENQWHVTTMLLAPLTSESRTVGVLALDYGGERHAFTPDEVRLAVAVGRLGALVLERERLRQAREREQARSRALAEANALMDEFLGIASHELRTPLTSAKTNVQLAGRQTQKLRRLLVSRRPGAPAPESSAGAEVASVERLELLLRRADQQMDRQSRLIEDLLDVSRIQAGKFEIRPKHMDLGPAVREAVEEQRQEAPARAITLDATEASVWVMADADRVGQVVTNYLTNALKYSPADTAIAVTLTVEDGWARVAVADRGPGLAPEEHERIWQRFHRVKGIESVLGSRIGLGLGLFICKTIIEQHGGRVGVTSAPGSGSTFSFALPLARVEA